jgi:hypothetical protein
LKKEEKFKKNVCQDRKAEPENNEKETVPRQDDKDGKRRENERKRKKKKWKVHSDFP